MVRVPAEPTIVIEGHDDVIEAHNDRQVGRSHPAKVKLTGDSSLELGKGDKRPEAENVEQ